MTPNVDILVPEYMWIFWEPHFEETAFTEAKVDLFGKVRVEPMEALREPSKRLRG